MEVKEVAEKLGVHVNTIYTYITTGQVKAVKKGRSWDVPIEEFEKLKARQKQTPRMIIESLNTVLDLLEKDKKHYEDFVLATMIKSGKDKTKQEALERLERALEYNEKKEQAEQAIKMLTRKREDFYTLINDRLLTMDEVIDYELSKGDQE